MSEAPLRLISEAGHDIENPSQAVVLEVLQGMEGHDEAFVILERNTTAGDFFIQTAANPGGGDEVSYQDGSTDQHYRVLVEGIGQVHDVFSWWVVDQPGWRD